jgi:DNA-binding GntR family transcriptional regulator
MHPPVDPSLTLPARDERTRKSDAVYEALLEAVLAGRLVSGTTISEVALARQLDVSRTPVHDALRQLAKDGLVEQRAGRRAVVAAFTRDDVDDIFEMRKLLEGEAARLAATRIDRQTLARLRASGEGLRRSRGSADWVAEWTDHDETFHDAIARASGSPRLWQDIARYRLLQRGFNKLTAAPDDLAQALEEHFRILEGLERRNPERASRSMVEHIQEWQAYFVNHFPR